MSVFMGISSLDCDSTVTFVSNGRIIFAAQEERFTRKKQQEGFPYLAIQEGFKYLGIDINDIDGVGYGWMKPEQERRMYLRGAKTCIDHWKRFRPPLIETMRNYINIQRRGRYVNHKEQKKHLSQLEVGLHDIGYKKEIKNYHHQLCHAASAYFTSNFDNALMVSVDGYGSGATGALFIGRGSKLSLINYIPSPQSLGGMYARVTKALGYQPNRHEGKVLGLAAYGDSNTFYKEIKKDFVLTDDSFIYLNAIDPYKYKKLFKEGKPEDLAASFQKVLEDVVTHVIKRNLIKHKLNKVCMAGGVTANVKMNQRISELEECHEIFVHPGMSDCGVGTGAAFLLNNAKCNIQSYRLKDVFFGPSFSEKEIESNLESCKYKYHYIQNVEKEIAELLSKNYVIGRFNGRMEYGPRALGNRSILCSTTDKSANNWLNKRLKRTEFMPFAPVTLDYKVDSMYKNMEKIAYTSEFMTITTDCTDEMKSLSPAAVHVDGTARPQVVTSTSNKNLYSILESYYSITGIPNLINTSFNVHEEPIVCSPLDALKTFSDGRLDFLAIGNFLVESPQLNHAKLECST